MARIMQNANGRGSLKCIQNLVNNNPNYVNRLITKEFKTLASENIIWVSPLKKDNYAEYRDHRFMEMVGAVTIENQLNAFWPKRGPQWDALAKTDNGKIILVEAKANVPEISSSGTKSKEPSKLLIEKSLAEVKQFLKIDNDVEWSKKYYQYTNRIAHLYFLREICKIDAYLLNIYFINDTHVPTKRDEFDIALNKLKNHLGIKSHKLKNFMADIFIEIDKSNQ